MLSTSACPEEVIDLEIAARRGEIADVHIGGEILQRAVALILEIGGGLAGGRLLLDLLVEVGDLLAGRR